MKLEYLKYEKIQYIIRYPEGYQEGEKYPVVVLLHGAGWRGNSIQRLSEHEFFTCTEKYTDIQIITVAPQCSEDTWFDMFETLQKLVRKITEESFADMTRIYLCGESMGGYASWQLAMSMPEYFAAMCPVCGGGMYWNAGRLIDIPIWAFHGAKDGIVRLEESQKMVDAVNRCGGNARLTVYPENEHDAWTDTYGNKEVLYWLLAQKKEEN